MQSAASDLNRQDETVCCGRPAALDARKLPLALVVGPTGVGKTEVAVRLAQRLNGEIISADSRLFYRGMDIGTAKPSADERAAVRHYLIDIAAPDETLSLAQFQGLARQTVAQIHANGRLPFLVGGTGQYLRAVAEGWQPPTVAPDAPLRTALEAWSGEIGGKALHERLSLLDPQAAQAIDPRNHRRTVRALEVIFSTGRRFSDQRARGPSPYCLLTIGLTRPREDLYRRIDSRIDLMLASGWVDEVRGLLARGYSPHLPSMSAIGYREIAAYLNGEMGYDDAVRLIRRNTRIYVRRQANWFKPSDPQIHWFDLSLTGVEEISALIQGWTRAK